MNYLSITLIFITTLLSLFILYLLLKSKPRQEEDSLEKIQTEINSLKSSLSESFGIMSKDLTKDFSSSFGLMTKEIAKDKRLTTPSPRAAIPQTFERRSEQ